MSASARPKWRCARPSPPPSTASRSPWWCRRRCWRASISRPSPSASAAFRSTSRRPRGWCRTRNSTQVKAGLADGSVDIVIGTHALLGKGIKFKDLGLLVVDEEQHFGVAHKEKLKTLRAEVHVLTLYRDADPAHACNWRSPACAISRSSPRRRSTGWRCAPSSRRSIRSSCARRCCARNIAAARRSMSARASRISPAPRISSTRTCRKCASRSRMARCRRPCSTTSCRPSTTANTTCCCRPPSSSPASTSRPPIR